jgi:uncharacterized membrane-anchored protein
MPIVRLAALLVSLLVLVAVPAGALGAPPARKPAPAMTAAPAATADPADAPAPKPEFAWKEGPVKVDLGHDLDLDLPEPYVYLGMPDAKKVMEKLGNFHNETLVGLVAGKKDDAKWLVTIRYEEAGYVKDDEKLDAEEILKSIREGTEEANKERQAHGFAALHVGDWAEAPRYDRASHHLVWALNASSDDGASVNYNTRVLGRRGFVALNLITDPADLAANKPDAATLLAATTYRAGARYEDFDEKKGDKVAEYGLAGLVLGGAGLGAAKLVKVGLLAKFGKGLLALLVAGKKAVVALFVGAAAFVKKIFGGKKQEE